MSQRDSSAGKRLWSLRRRFATLAVPAEGSPSGFWGFVREEETWTQEFKDTDVYCGRAMGEPFNTIGEPRPRAASDSGLGPFRVVPFGVYGAGVLTEHPAGLLVVAAVCFIAWTQPEARWFSFFSLSLGVLVGLAMRLRNRRRTFDLPPSLRRK